MISWSALAARHKTNIYADQLKSCLDLISTDIPSVHTRSTEPLGKSDHVAIVGYIQTSHGRDTPDSRQIWCWSKANANDLRDEVNSRNWTDVLDAEDVTIAWQTWKARLLEIAKQHIPRRSVKGSTRRRPWMNPTLQQEVRKKHRLFRDYKKSPSPHAWSKFKEQRNKVTSMVRKAKSDFVLALGPDDHQSTGSNNSIPERTADHPLNLPRLHQFLGVFFKSKNSAVPSLLEQSGRIVEDDQEKAELLNSFFVRQSSLSASAGDPPVVNTEPETDPSQILTQLEVSLDDVRQALHTLDPRKAPGCDGLPTRLIVMVADEIAPCVHHIFTLSLRTANLPPDWKSAIVSPVYKQRGSRQQASNYRPISLLSVLSKCLEKVVFKPLYSHLNRFLPKHQSGFRQKDSTAYQLARLIHILASALDDGKTAFACFYDLSKAFDRVWHKGLLAKLHHFGVRGQAHAWLECYLSNRRQSVRINNTTSSWLAVPAGVPQGSVLGPLLFLAYTIDLPQCVSDPTQCDQFADDTALTTVSHDSVACEQQLQVSVNATSRWLSDWRLTVNTDKTVVMEFTRRPIPSDLAINLNGTQLRKVKEQRHLGLILSSDLRWTEHTNRVLSKAARLLHTLRRLRNSLSRQALLFYYCLYIRPVIEYASVAWPKLPAHLRDRLERFQRRALKIIIRKPIFQHCDHNDLLLTLNQASLQSRRHFQSALVGFHLANQTAPPHLQEVCYPRASVDHSLRHHNFFQLPKANSTLFQSSPLYFASHIFNILPKHIQSSTRLSEFKKKAQQYFLSPSCPCSMHALTST